ncbi:RNA polymerase sigma factor [Streptomyces sp. NPDC051109]|uniref:RNA polymerase sigma factor n=1 Tax=Streptomyces sp. NPDC051109 TaxID=3365642 RepID=UPI0037B8C140
MDDWPRVLKMIRLEAYAWTILKHQIVDQQRRRKRAPQPTDIAAFEAALAIPDRDPYEALTDTIQLYSAVRRLSERQRDAVVLHYVLDLSHREAAGIMGIEEASVRSLLRMARRRLAALLGVPANDGR